MIMNNSLDTLDKSVVLADFAGWSQIHVPKHGMMIKRYYGYPPVFTLGEYVTVPDFFLDLETLRSIEQHLTTEQCIDYFNVLRSKTQPSDLSEKLKTIATIFLSAQIRAEVLFECFMTKSLYDILVRV